MDLDFSRLEPRILSLEHTADAAALYSLAVQQYDIIRVSQLEELPATDARSPADGSPAVEMCLRVRTGFQLPHVDRGLFNIVTGTGAAIANLYLPGIDTSRLADTAGATLLIPGMTYALLMSQRSRGVPPVLPEHFARLREGQQLTVLAVKLAQDIPLPTRVAGCSSLHAALRLCFGRAPETDDARQHVSCTQPGLQGAASPAAGRKRARKGTSDAEPKVINVICKHITGYELVVSMKMDTLLEELFELVRVKWGHLLPPYRYDGESFKIVFDGRRLRGDETPDYLGMEDNDVINVLYEQRGD